MSSESPRTLADVESVIAERRKRMAYTPFFRALSVASTVEEVRAFAGHLTFYVLAFQDVLRLVDALVKEPQIHGIVHRHFREDKGHEQWFLHDVAVLQCERSLAWVFGPEHELPRDISYQLIAEVIRAEDDRERLVLPLVLEAVGAEFFGRVIAALDRAGFDGSLRYFGGHHQQVEADHDIFTANSHSEMAAIPFDFATYERTLAMAHRSFDALERLAAHLEVHRSRAGS